MELDYKLTGGRLSTSTIVMGDGRGSVLATAPLLQTTSPSTTAAQEFDAWGKPISIASKVPRHGDVGFEADAAFGTYSFGRRVYDPKLRRWLSADPLLSANPEVDGEAAQLDLWGYAGANPARWTDTNGTCISDRCFDRQSAAILSMSTEEKVQLGEVMAMVAPGGDFVSLGISGRDVFSEPTWGNGALLAVDVVGAALPVLPAFGTLGRALRLSPASDIITDGNRLLSETAGPLGHISPGEVLNKTPQEIDANAKRLGHTPKGKDPMNGVGAYVDPQTGKQRILSHPDAKPPHGHVNDPDGKRVDAAGNVVAPESPEAHLEVEVKR